MAHVRMSSCASKSTCRCSRSTRATSRRRRRRIDACRTWRTCVLDIKRRFTCRPHTRHASRRTSKWDIYGLNSTCTCTYRSCRRITNVSTRQNTPTRSSSPSDAAAKPNQAQLKRWAHEIMITKSSKSNSVWQLCCPVPERECPQTSFLRPCTDGKRIRWFAKRAASH